MVVMVRCVVLRLNTHHLFRHRQFSFPVTVLSLAGYKIHFKTAPCHILHVYKHSRPQLQATVSFIFQSSQQDTGHLL